MQLLLDTHALLWWLAGDPIDEEAATLISDPANIVAVSVASAWEIAIKSSIGKLRLDSDDSFASILNRNGFEPLSISIEHAETVGTLPQHHRDPFDRMLVAQARVEGLSLMTRDEIFRMYDVNLVLC